jgi:hypothetical protein
VSPASRAPKKSSNGSGLSDRAAGIIIGVVTAVWAANIVAGMVAFRGYQPSESINGIFLTIVGGALVLRSKSKDGE